MGRFDPRKIVAGEGATWASERRSASKFVPWLSSLRGRGPLIGVAIRNRVGIRAPAKELVSHAPCPGGTRTSKTSTLEAIEGSTSRVRGL
jgi:hypothetical protein